MRPGPVPLTMGLYKVEGIVLRRRQLGEADRLVTVLTRDRGKLTVAARGARRPRSRLGGRLEPATRFRALVAEGRTLDVISQVEVLDAHAAARAGLERMGAASVVLEMADRALADRHPHPDVFRLLDQALALVAGDVGDVAWQWFAARLVVLTGHRPVLGRCAACGHRVRGPGLWSAARGGTLHIGCGSRDPRARPLPQGAAALLAFLVGARAAAVRSMAPAPADLAASGDALREYMEACWETRLRAPGVLSQVRAAADTAARRSRAAQD